MCKHFSARPFKHLAPAIVQLAQLKTLPHTHRHTDTHTRTCMGFLPERAHLASPSAVELRSAGSDCLRGTDKGIGITFLGDGCVSKVRGRVVWRSEVRRGRVVGSTRESGWKYNKGDSESLPSRRDSSLVGGETPP